MSLGMMSSRDWNEELQSARELPQTNIHENIVRDRTVFRVSATPVTRLCTSSFGPVACNLTQFPHNSSFKTSVIYTPDPYLCLKYLVQQLVKMLASCRLHQLKALSSCKLSKLDIC